MKILVVGRSGQVANALAEVASRNIEIVRLGRPEIDLKNPASLVAAMDRHSPEIVVCAGAYTAVDQAETEFDEARSINTCGPIALARQCETRNVPLIQLSTDFVFSGEKSTPYVEADPCEPVNVYGSTKLDAERGIAKVCRRYIILRTSWVYSHIGRNFVRTILRHARSREELDIVEDQSGSPTSATDLAKVVLAISERVRSDEDPALSGVFHAAGEGVCSWAAFGETIFEMSGRQGGPVARVNRISSSEYPGVARRPKNSALNCDRMEQVFGLRQPHWRQSLSECISRMASAGFNLSD